MTRKKRILLAWIFGIAGIGMLFVFNWKLLLALILLSVAGNQIRIIKAGDKLPQK